MVVWREESREKITSVGKRPSPWWSSGARKDEKKSQVSENDQVLGGRLARGKSRKNHKCRKTTKSLVVVWREIHLGLVIFRPSVGGRRARRSPGTCDFSAKCRKI